MSERQESTEQSTSSASESTENVTRPGELALPIAKKREDFRALFAGALASLFIIQVVAIGACATFCGEGAWVRVQEFAQITFGTVAGLVGSAVGYYFGSQRP